MEHGVTLYRMSIFQQLLFSILFIYLFILTQLDIYSTAKEKQTSHRNHRNQGRGIFQLWGPVVDGLIIRGLLFVQEWVFVHRRACFHITKYSLGLGSKFLLHGN